MHTGVPRKCSSFRETSTPNNFSQQINWKIWEKVGRGKREDDVCSICFLLKSEGKEVVYYKVWCRNSAGHFLLWSRFKDTGPEFCRKKKSKYFACMVAAVVMERHYFLYMPGTMIPLYACFANDCILFCFKSNSSTYFQYLLELWHKTVWKYNLKGKAD